ncbi:hypothetical protein PR202_ga08767 [Eleusine coracana subsp. coracana]|uniref:Uncharacterized protein n=1 Tax=Eleusine coracana subsp. coracana TaxID=191504 RepID=A0AAV5C240_ELECO|nr:hypothetical protein PR202_ga08767 [Eleusine coracana subsp. coracana]
METTRRGTRRLLLLPLSILCLAVAVLLASAATPPAGRGVKRRWAGFDYYVLALQWPGTICRQTSNCCATNGCCRPRPLKWFTIHINDFAEAVHRNAECIDNIFYCNNGLWPQYNNGGWPSCCRPTTFNINKILMLMPILEKYWPSLYCGSSSTCFGGRGPFWAHEICMSNVLNLLFSFGETHGTCAYPEMLDEYDYFSTALYLYSKYNVTKALRKAHIYPRSGRKYAVGHIVAVIEYAFGTMPSVVCSNGSVQELRLCFHKDYQPRDCTFETNNAPNRRSHCPRYVTFPSYKPSLMANSTVGISSQANGELHAYG